MIATLYFVKLLLADKRVNSSAEGNYTVERLDGQVPNGTTHDTLAQLLLDFQPAT